MVRLSKLAAVLTTCVVLAGCSEPLALDTIQLGRSLNEDQSVASQATTFKPNETVHVAVLTKARGEGTIAAKWYLGTQLLSEREKQVSFNGAGATEFNLQSATGFPEGDYSVELFIDGVSVGRRNFNIVK
jgi:hypothetical protein